MISNRKKKSYLKFLGYRQAIELVWNPKIVTFFVTGCVILIALVLLFIGAIVTAFFTSWVNMIIDNVSLSFHQQAYQRSLVHFQYSLTEFEN